MPAEEHNNCVRDAIELFISSPRDELSSIKVPQFDPLLVSSATFNINYNRGSFGGATFKVRNLKAFGFKKLKVQRVKSNFNDTNLDILGRIFVPSLFASGIYKSNFVLGGTTFNSRGQFNVTLKDLTVKASLKGMVKNGFMNLHNLDTIPDAKDLKISISGLFPEPELSE